MRRAGADDRAQAERGDGPDRPLRSAPRHLASYATAGQIFHDAAADEALFGALRESVDRARVELHELDLDINDQEFALTMANWLHDLCESG